MNARHWCRICGLRIHWIASRHAWAHDAKGADHGPIPTTRQPEPVA